MNTKKMIPAMVLAMALVLFWSVGVKWYYARMGWEMPGAATTQPSSTTQPTTGPTTGASIATSQGAVATIGPATATTTGGNSITVNAATAPRGAVLGSDESKDPNYSLAVRLSPQGAGLDSVVLNQFRQTVDGKSLYTYQQPYTTDPLSRALATRSITVNGATISLADKDWNLEGSALESATYSLEIAGATGPLVRVRKTYQVRSRTATASTSDGYEVGVQLAFENLSTDPITISGEFNGTNIPPVEVYRGLDRQIVGGYDAAGYVEAGAHTVESFKKDAPPQDLTHSAKNNYPLLWAGTVGVYFDAIVRPLPIEQGKQVPGYIARVQSQGVNNDHPDLHDVVSTFTTTDLKLLPRQTLSLPMEVFFGPKQRKLLNNSYYSAPLIGFNHTLVLGGSCAWCTFQWLVDVLVWMLEMLHMVLRDWGLAIIALVCIVRAILHPITKKSQVNMMKMSKMGPEMERLKKKYGDDKEAIAKAQMEVYKSMGATPVWGCLPMFLQMPIFIALFAALNSTFELRHASFLWGMTWIGDLSQPDRLIYFPNHPINLIFFHVDALNLLPILVAVVSFFSAKYTPKPPATTPEQEQQQKMMQWMTLIMPLIFYNMPSGLNLYYLTSMSIGIIEGRVIRKHIREREEEEKAGKVIIDGGMTRRRKGAPVTAIQADENPGCLGGFMANIQERVEQIRNEAEKRGK